MTIENIKIFFQPAYLLSPYPSSDTKFTVPFLIFFGGLVILSIVIFLMARKKKKKPIFSILVRVYNWLLWVGLVGLSLVFFRYEGVPFLSMRLILALWLLVFVFWGIGILWFRLKGYKKIAKEYREKLEREKYFKKSK